MEFHSKLLQPPTEQRVRGWNGPLPFYMAYPGYLRPGQEAMLIQDLEYLQQMYPTKIKRYQQRISEIVDRTDYEGSMIYDEYPDRYSLRAIVLSIQKVLEKEEEDPPSEEMIQILLLNEIYKRRHGSRRGRISSYF